MLYNGKIKILDDGTFLLREYDKKIYREENKEEKEPVKKEKEKTDTVSENKEIRKDNLTRSRNEMLNIVNHNFDKWQTFCTLTYKYDLSRDQALKDWANFVRKVKRVAPDVIMIKVDEFTKKGRPHFHFLCNYPVDSILIQLQEGKENMFDFKYWNHGFTQVYDLKLTDFKFNPGLYMAKYMYKDFDERHYGKRKYTVINRGLLDIPEEIHFLKSDTPQMIDVINYLEAKGYQLHEYIHESDKAYIPNFLQLETKIEKDDVAQVRYLVDQALKGGD